ncbi:MAG: hypothetical protein P0S96_04060 [Simkaniaceae bacterium]|nr:hypothetical protein [Candidatus Sacchlamyda saccharinae]
MSVVDYNNSSVLGAFNDALNSAGDGFARWVVIPPLKMGYQLSGDLCARVAGCFSTSLEKSVRNNWKDPVSTDFLLALFKPIEGLARRVADHKPSQARLFHFIDQSVVSHAQHLYVYVKEMNKLLELPKGIKEFVRASSFNNVLSRSARLGGKAFIAIDSMRLQARKIALTIFHYLVVTIDLFFQYMLLIPDVEILKYLLDAIKAGQSKLHGKFSDHAIKAIEKREKRVRAQIVANVANCTIDYVTTLASRVSLKVILGLGAYFKFERTLQSAYSISTTPLQFTVGSITACLLWRNVFQPYFYEYYKAYEQDFNPDNCTMSEFLDRYSMKGLTIPVEGAKNFFLSA